jgi:hypothetical protein
MGLIRCPETSVNDYHSTLRNIPEERRSHQHRGASLKSRILEPDRLLHDRPLPVLSPNSILLPHLCHCARFENIISIFFRFFKIAEVETA